MPRAAKRNSILSRRVACTISAAMPLQVIKASLHGVGGMDLHALIDFLQRGPAERLVSLRTGRLEMAPKGAGAFVR